MTSIKKPQVLLTPIIQILALIVFSSILYFSETDILLSFWWGGLIAITSHLYFTLYAFRYTGAQASRLVVRSFYQGEIGKYLITLLGFSGVFLMLEDTNAPLLFSGYGAMLLLQWATTYVVFKNH